MRLTPDQEKLLQGADGKAQQTAMAMLVAVGRAMDASDLISVASAHIVIDAFAMAGTPQSAKVMVDFDETGA